MTRPYKLLLAALSVVASISIGVTHSESASAHPYNQAEVNAYYRCTNTVGGAIWVNNGNYYDGSVQVNSNDNYVGVAIRGSAYNCGGRAGNIYAVNVSSTDQGRLGGLSSSVLYRGYVGNPPSWSTQGGDIYATLNISDVPQNTTTSPQSHYRTIGIYRCFSRDGSNVTGSCDTEVVGIYITRAGRPITWNINGQTYIGKGRIQDSQRRSDANYRPSQGGAQTIISGTPGETVHWNHLMRNNGPDATNRNLQVSIDQLTFDVGGFNGRSGNSGFSLPAWQNSPASPSQLIYEAYQATPLSRYNRVISQDDVGKRICQRVAWNPGSSSNGGWSWAAGGNGSWETGGYDCVDVPYKYTIYPQITSNSSFLTDGSTATMDPRVQNGGRTKANGNIQSTVYEFVIPGGKDIDFNSRFNSAPAGAPRYYEGMNYPNNRQDACATVEAWYRNDIRNCKPLNGEGSGSGDIAVNNGGGSYGSATSTLNASDYSPGDRVCRFLVVRNISNTETNSTKRRASIPTCFSIGKKPKVQVHGGNLSVGKMFEGTSRPLSINSKVQTSLVTRTNTSTAIPITSGSKTGAISGLWKTGVNDDDRKLGQDVRDEHWDIARVGSLISSQTQTCQRAVTGGPNSTTLTGSPPTNVPSRTVYETNNGLQAGRYVGSGSGLAIVGNDPNQAVKNVDGQSPWRITSPNARWISQNMYGHHYTSTSCKDPTRDNLNYASQMRSANVWVFKLKDGIDINSNVNLASLRLTIRGAVDNRVKFYANGCELRADGPTVDGNWQDPGFDDPSKRVGGATANPIGNCAYPNGFKHGNNTFEVYVASGYSNVGLLIDEFAIEGQMSQPSSATYGSWAEYGIFAPSIVDLTASGSGLNIPQGATSDKQADWSKLTYGNSGKPCDGKSFGCYTHGDTTLPDPSKRYPEASAATLQQNSVSVDDLQGLYKPRANVLTISGGTIKKGQWVVINAQNADVHITGDLKYQTDGIGSISDLPQLIIIAKNITIADNVGEINAWLVAKPTGATGGVINTCTTAGNATNTSNLSITDCLQRLTVNGPVVSDRLILRRTAGSENAEQQGEPAEIFNLRPDVYLWAYSQAGTKTNLRTTAIRDLPPRW